MELGEQQSWKKVVGKVKGYFRKDKKKKGISFHLKDSNVICNVNICLLVIPLGDRLLIGDEMIKDGKFTNVVNYNFEVDILTKIC